MEVPVRVVGGCRMIDWMMKPPSKSDRQKSGVRGTLSCVPEGPAVRVSVTVDSLLASEPQSEQSRDFFVS